MPDTEDLDQIEDEAPEAPQVPAAGDSELAALKRKNKELQAEVRKFRQHRREQFLSQNPGLDETLIDGLPLDKLEQILKVVRVQDPAEQPPATPAAAPSPAEQAFAASQAMSAAAASGSPKTYSAKELAAMVSKGEITSLEMNQIIAEGRMR